VTVGTNDLPLTPDALIGLATFAAALLVLAAASALLSRRGARRRAAEILSLRQRAAGDEAALVLALQPENGGEPRPAVLAKDRLTVFDSLTGPTPDPRKVTKASIVQSGRCGLRLETDGAKWWVTSFEPMARAYTTLLEAGVPVEAFAVPGHSEKVKAAIERLHPKERQALTTSLVEGEVIVDLLEAVDYEGSAGSSGSKAGASILVTTFRLALFARTQTVTQSGNVQTTTTHFNVVTYPFPFVETATARPAVGVRRFAHRLDFAYKADSPMKGQQPSPVLDATRGAVLVPASICSKGVRVADEAPATSRFVRDALVGGIGFAILGGGFAGLVAVGLRGMVFADDLWFVEWIPAIAVAGAVAGFVLRALGTYELFAEKSETALALAACAGRSASTS
jgi:hypothetical protein